MLLVLRLFIVPTTALIFGALLAGCPGRLAFCNDDLACELGEVCVLGSCVDEVDPPVDGGVDPPVDGGVVVGCAAPLEGGAFRVCGTVGSAHGTSTGALDVRPVASSPAGRTTMTGGQLTVR